MRLIPLKSASQVGLWSARYIVDRINAFKPTSERPFVLGLPTGGWIIGLLVHGLLELQTHHAGIDHQGQSDQDHVMAGNAQCNRYTAVAQCTEDQQEEVIGFDWRGPVH